MTLNARHSVHDFSMDLDFAAAKVKSVAGHAFDVVWSDIDKGTGHTCVAGMVNGHPVLRFYKTVGEVSYSTVPIDENNSHVSKNGRCSHPAPAGQILLEDPRPDLGPPEAAVQGALAFLRQVFKPYEPVWMRAGTTWPVALLRQREGATRHWAFVQVPTYIPDTRRAVVDLCMSTDALMAVMPRPGRQEAPGF